MRQSLRAATRSCPRGQVVPARDADGAPVAVIRLWSGQVCVIADRCPHDGGPLSDGFIEDDRLVCARHQWQLDPQTGERIGGRCPAAIVDSAHLEVDPRT